MHFEQLSRRLQIQRVLVKIHNRTHPSYLLRTALVAAGFLAFSLPYETGAAR